MDVTEQHTVVRISPWWVVFGVFLMVGTGLAGGLIAQRFHRPELRPLPDNNSEVIATVQEITISPSKATADLLEQYERSIVLLGESGTGIVITNDGLLVSAYEGPTTDLIARDFTGKILALDFVGTDALYGLSYWKVNNGVPVAIDILSESPRIGSRLLAVRRDSRTTFPVAKPWQVHEYRLPGSLVASGIQRLLSGTFGDIADTGSVLLNDEGALSGIVLDASAGLALTPEDIRFSLDRATTNRRETDPLAAVGVTVTYGFALTEDGRNFVTTVSRVAPRSAAALAGVQIGDVITKVQGKEISWTNGVASLLGSHSNPEIVVVRDGDTLTLQLNNV